MTPTFLDFARGLGHRLTRAQSVLCAVCFAGAEPSSFTGADRDIAFRLFGAAQSVPADLRSVVLWCKGARIGGTWLAALRVLHLALTAALGSLAPGESAFGLLVGPDMRLPQQALRYILGALRSRPELAALIASETTEAVVLRRPDGRTVTIEILPATRGGSALRGRSIVAAVMTEASFFRDRDFAVNDAEIYRALLPRILPGGQLILESTPWAESGLVWELHRDNHGTPTTCIAAHCPTTLMRDDTRTLRLVERERARDPENARREFDAEFITGGSGFFFDAALLRAAIDPALEQCLQPPPGAQAFVGGDLALYRDASALAVVHRHQHEQIIWYSVAELLERKPAKGSPLNLASVVSEFASVAQRQQADHIMADHHLLPVANSLMPEGVQLVPCPTGQQGKIEAFVCARDLFRAGAVRLPASATGLVAQMCAVTSTPTPGGGLQIRSPRRGGTHGDVVSALVLALYCASALSREWAFTSEYNERAARMNAQPIRQLSPNNWGGAGRSNDGW